MAIKVHIGNTTGGSKIEQTYDVATGIAVQDGHLLVTIGNPTANSVVAAYAPGKWLSAERAS